MTPWRFLGASRLAHTEMLTQLFLYFSKLLYATTTTTVGSANPKNIETYIKNGRKMKDVLGLNLQRSAKQIPDSEFDDMEWPYNQTMTTDSESDAE